MLSNLSANSLPQGWSPSNMTLSAQLLPHQKSTVLIAGGKTRPTQMWWEKMSGAVVLWEVKVRGQQVGPSDRGLECLRSPHTLPPCENAVRR